MCSDDWREVTRGSTARCRYCPSKDPSCTRESIEAGKDRRRLDEEESREPYANGTSTGTVVRRGVTFMGVGRQLGEEEWWRREEGRENEEFRGEKRGRRGETNGEVVDGGGIK
jgi:hypothetical protein